MTVTASVRATSTTTMTTVAATATLMTVIMIISVAIAVAYILGEVGAFLVAVVVPLRASEQHQGFDVPIVVCCLKSFDVLVSRCPGCG